jgi:YVTN family beta-propeller protein
MGISGGFPLYGIAVSPDGNRVYVADYSGGTVPVIDTTTPNTVVETIAVGLHPWGVAISPAPLYPITKDQCKNNGWTAFGFKNQGQCIQYVHTRNKHDHKDKHDYGDK